MWVCDQSLIIVFISLNSSFSTVAAPGHPDPLWIEMSSVPNVLTRFHQRLLGQTDSSVCGCVLLYLLM